jgi:transposase
MSKQQYSADFKIEAVKRFLKSGEPLTKVAEELRVRPTTFHGWVSKYNDSSEVPFPDSGHLKPEDEKLRKLEKEIKDLKEENEILKKAAAYFARNQK